MNVVYYVTDADDFDPDAGFSKGPEVGGEEETWEGEDEGLELEKEKQPDVKSKSKCELSGLENVFK